MSKLLKELSLKCFSSLSLTVTLFQVLSKQTFLLTLPSLSQPLSTLKLSKTKESTGILTVSTSQFILFMKLLMSNLLLLGTETIFLFLSTKIFSMARLFKFL
jgi:hypothetical protein